MTRRRSCGRRESSTARYLVDRRGHVALRRFDLREERRGVPVGPNVLARRSPASSREYARECLRTCRQSSSGPTSGRRGRLGAVEPRMEPLSRNEPATPHTGGWDGAVAHALVSDAAGDTEQLRHLVDAVGQGLCAVMVPSWWVILGALPLQLRLRAGRTGPVAPCAAHRSLTTRVNIVDRPPDDQQSVRIRAAARQPRRDRPRTAVGRAAAAALRRAMAGSSRLLASRGAATTAGRGSRSSPRSSSGAATRGLSALSPPARVPSLRGSVLSTGHSPPAAQLIRR